MDGKVKLFKLAAVYPGINGLYCDLPFGCKIPYCHHNDSKIKESDCNFQISLHKIFRLKCLHSLNFLFTFAYHFATRH